MPYLYQQAVNEQLKGKFYWGSLYGSAKALTLIEFAKTQKQAVLVIATDIAEQQHWHQALNFYNQSSTILSFDNWEVLAFDHFSPQPDIISNRLKTLAKLQNTQTNTIVITTAETLLQRLCPLEFIKKYSFNLRINNTLIVDKFALKLTKIGYKKVSTVMDSGEFSIKGSLIDLYPVDAISPYRIDLFDTQIESIRIFDPTTQLSSEQVEGFSLLPAREFAFDDKSIEIFKANYLQEFANLDDFIISEVLQNRLPAGIEFYLPLFFNKTSSLFDYLPEKMIISTQQDLSALIDDTYSNINVRFEQAKLHLDRPPLPIEKVFLHKNMLLSQLQANPQLLLGESHCAANKKGINFKSSLPPPVLIEAQSKNPLTKLLNFINQYKGKILIVCASDGRRNMLIDLLSSQQKPVHRVANWQDFTQSKRPLNIIVANLSQSLCHNDIAVITETDLFGSEVIQQKIRRRAKHKDFNAGIKSLLEIKIGDPVVHENYGVGRYLGLKTRIFDTQAQDFLALQYADSAKLMVPMTALNLISRYAGVSSEYAPLHKLGSNQWAKAKKKASEALYDIAAELLDIYAQRAAQMGFAFPPPEDAYSAFVVGFPFEETPDQIKTMSQVMDDMLAQQPMDRLVCGDVGFGKTEIAMRAAFLAVEGGKQVAILAPTTLLVNQHHQSFIDRFTNFPIKIAALSRFQNLTEQKKIQAELKSGIVDIVIGTHKLIYANIQYQDLGLVIIDEEHRFGVKQKEMLKKLRGQCDILTLTATPIPRTLNMALGSLRCLSVIATPPPSRNPIQTFVNEWDNTLIKDACYRELHRGGQIFVLHNDIDSIDNMADTLRQLIPNISARVAHAQMPSAELESIMGDFYHGRFQLLVCSSIIESGIDIPNANTIIINNAQNFGLAQLHQLRGRVGRSHHQAYAYLLIKSHQSLSKNAKKRLDAIASLKDLGSGFMLANHDLEIRGAGDLLGDNQSGKINEIGFNLYHDLLKRTIEALKSGAKINFDEPRKSIEINSGIACIIPADYLFDIHQRLVFYKRIAAADNENELKNLKIELIDRFGLLPDASENLFAATTLKLLCEKIGIDKISIYDDKTLITFNHKTMIEPTKIINLIKQQPQIYQLKGQNQLHIKQIMPPNIERIERLTKLLQGFFTKIDDNVADTIA